MFRPCKTWQAHKGIIIWLGSVRISSHQIISHCRNDSVIVWNLDGEALHRLPTNHEGFCKCDLLGNLLAIPQSKNTIQVVDITSPSMSRTQLDIKKDVGAVMAVRLFTTEPSSSSSLRIVAAYESGSVCLWDESGGTILQETRVEDCMPTCLALNDNKEILLGTSSETLHVLDPSSLSRIRQVALTNPGLSAIALRPTDGRIYATAGWDKRLRLFSSSHHKKLCVLLLHEGTLNALAFAGPFLACGGNDAQISLWDLYNNPNKSK